MTDLANLISAAVAAKMTPEFIEKEVDTRIEKLVVESINSALRTYSDTGRLIEEAIKKALQVNQLDLPSYGSVVTAILKNQIEALVAPLVAGRLAADMEEILSLAAQQVKLSAIAEGMIERYRDRNHDAWGDCITVIVEETSGGFHWLYLDEEHRLQRSEKYKARFHIGTDKEGKIFSLRISDHNVASSTYFGRGHGLEQKLRAFYAVGTIIEIDEDAVITGVGDY